MVPKAGDAHPIKLLENYIDEPLVLTRDAEADIHCLSNVCTHRGNLMVYEPGVVYILLGLKTEEVVPSPKLHVERAVVGLVLLTMFKVELTQTAAGMVKLVLTLPTLMKLDLMMVSLQPVSLVAINLTV